MAKRTKHLDVKKVKTYYIRHNVTFEQLAKRYGVSRTTINKYRKEDPENWEELKEQYNKDVSHKTLEKLKEKDSKALVDAQEKLDKILYSAIGVLAEVAADDKQFNRYSTSPNERMAGFEEYLGKKVDTKSLLNYIKAVSEINTMLIAKREAGEEGNSITVAFEDFKDEYAE